MNSLPSGNSLSNYSIWLSFSMAVSVILLAQALKYRQQRRGKIIMAIAFAGIITPASVLMSLHAPNPEIAAWWHGAVRLAVYALIPPIGIFFVNEYVPLQFNARIFRQWKVWVMVIPCITFLLALTNPWHHWFIRSYEMEEINGYFLRTGWSFAPWFWVETVFSYLIGIGIFGGIVKMLKRAGRLPRFRTFLTFSVILLIALGQIIDTLQIFSASFLLAPIISGFTSFLLLLGIWHIGLLDILPFARETLVEYLPDAIIMIDEEFRLLDINRAGVTLFQLPFSELSGKNLLQFLSAKDQALMIESLQANEKTLILPMVKDGIQRWFDVYIKSVLIEGDVPEGKIVILRDVTDLKTLQEHERDHIAIKERQRLARDFHDSVNQTLFSAQLTSEMLLAQKENIEPAHLWESIEYFTTLISSALREMRVLLLELRPEGLDKAGIGIMISELAETTNAKLDAKIHVEKKVNATLPRDVKFAFYRITQEALNNIVKHANCKNIFVQISVAEKAAQLTIRDDGQGFDAEQIFAANLGLKIMQERADEIGAALNIQSHAGAGTTITCEWEKEE